ncbi:YkvA family protein [Virgibacillus byunsanensis]|uniref:YkvA family protein n=1 Tax=Virgibacillus byunsanensis TaxID=570945 RepID=A0ABW3LK91_9BACI
MVRFFKRIRFLFKFHKSIPFLKDFFITREVSIVKKVLFVFLIMGYIIFPFDIIPDFLLFFGILDDATVAILLLQQMFKAAPDALKEKHKLLE